ncbi:MAG: RNA polymerase sigma factor [Sedimentisphaerales bacterium]|nr:RNA polymerase sigma factor [Sedimentisphaerales bacterium]
MDKDAEREIAIGLQKGDRQAWLRLYEAYARRVWTNVARLMGYACPAVADVVQETFLAAARSARNFDPGRGMLWLWLWGIARRQIALHYRKQDANVILAQAKTWWHSLDGQTIDWIDEKAAPPPDVLEASELATLVRSALNQLPADYQTVLMAKYIDGQPTREIAQNVQCSSDAVTSRLVRAKKAFRKAFKTLTQSAPAGKEVSL